MDSLWASLKSDWHSEAVCRTLPVYEAGETFVPTVETDLGLAAVQDAFCNLCPVREKCLNSALINNDLGYWGGTSTAQRQAMKRVRSRAKCPACATAGPVRLDGFEVCIRCGASWRGDAAPPARKIPLKKRRLKKTQTVQISGGAASCL